ncbi:MAG: ribosomal-processing cysteine protease Prp [Lachnospira sp.]|nr:ribosomal-processing cysteine protease Prp [Lachnospira sp.]
MTHITIYKSSCSHEIVGFRTEGHAGYANSGEDVVCAAVSVLTINTINSLEQFTDDDFETSVNEEQAFIECMITSEQISLQAQVLLNALDLGLTMISADNPDYLLLTVKEV